MERKLLSSKRIQAGSKKTCLTVLRAAERVFAKQGFAGTLMQDISRAFGVSQPLLIYPYFKTKRVLYNEIKRQMMRRFEAFLADTICDIDTGKCIPETMLRRGFEFIKGNPNLVRLGAWTQLGGDTAPWPGKVEARAGLLQMFSAAQEDGTVRKYLDPRPLTILMESLMFSWWEHRQTYLRIHKEAIESNKMDEKVLEAMVGVFLKRALEYARAN